MRNLRRGVARVGAGHRVTEVHSGPAVVVPDQHERDEPLHHLDSPTAPGGFAGWGPPLAVVHDFQTDGVGCRRGLPGAAPSTCRARGRTGRRRRDARVGRGADGWPGGRRRRGGARAGCAAAAAGYDILVRFVYAALRTLATLGLVVALGGYLAGRSAGAVQIRSALGRMFTGLGRGRVGRALRSGPVGSWVYAYRGLLRGTAVGLAVLVFVLLDRPSGVDVLFVALGLVLALAVIEFVGQEPEPPTHGIAAAAGAAG